MSKGHADVHLCHLIVKDRIGGGVCHQCHLEVMTHQMDCSVCRPTPRILHCTIRHPLTEEPSQCMHQVMSSTQGVNIVLCRGQMLCYRSMIPELPSMLCKLRQHQDTPCNYPLENKDKMRVV